jgi:hypothetical protein
VSDEDLNIRIRRLLDAGYSVRLSRWEAPGVPAGADCYAEITSGMGSTWRSFGETPHDALRGCWPLGDGPGKGGCAHCGTLGCEVQDCETCAAYPEGEPLGVCGVCGAGYPLADDEDEDELDGDDWDGEEDESFGVPAGPDTPCRASSQLGTACAERGLHFEHDDHNGTTWAAM